MNFQTPLNENDDINNMPQEEDSNMLSAREKDALGEIGNICMGTSATTLSTLLGKRVNITTPKVSISRGNEYLDDYEKPVVLTEVSYTQGLDGLNTFLIKKDDALIITSLLMGGEGKSDEEGLEEFYLSAISEVMNQMVGSSSTALANTLHVQVNISPPNIRELTDDEKSEKRQSEEVAIIISFRMEIEDLLVSNIMQIMPFDFGKKLAFTLNGEHESAEEEKVDDSAVQERSEESAAMDMESSVTQNNVFDSAVQEIFEESAAMDMESSVAQNKNSDSIKQEMSRESAVMGMESSVAQTKKAASTVQEISRESTVMDMGNSAVQNRNADREKKVELKSVQFQTFDNIGAPGSMASGNNIDLIIDVPLQVTVVLGKSKKNIKEILDLGMGSIIVLDRLAGEMVDVLVNGKMFARGEVVVINDNYGVRITELAESNQSKA